MLAADPTEQHNLADTMPGVAADLRAQLQAHDRELGPPSFPALIEAAIPIDRTQADPYVPGEEFAYWSN